MGFLRRRDIQKQEPTKDELMQSEYWKEDKNNDGIPDYLQNTKNKLELKSLVRQVSDSNMQEVDAQREKETIEMKWRGFKYSPDTGSYVKWSKRIITEEGIMELSAILDAFVNKHQMNTRYSEDFVMAMVLDAINKINALIADNQKNWQIAESDLNAISLQCEGMIISSLTKSIGDSNRNHVTQRVRITENRQTQSNPSI